jgi:DNA-binding response OmpR family regulator
MKSRILIIEDDPVLGSVITEKLNASGYEATLITDGAVGIETARKTHPDIILLDILLPTKNGYEIMEEISRDDALKGIPVVIISNSGQPVEIERMIKLGAKDYLIKAQFTPEEVLAKVRAQLPHANDNSVLAGKKVLVVEDDMFLSAVLLKKLNNEKCAVAHAMTGEEALAKSVDEKPDIILLDLVLPGANGLDILKTVKESPATKAIPIVILSNLSQQEDMDRAKELGAERFLVKAMSTPEDIIALVAEILAKKK